MNWNFWALLIHFDLKQIQVLTLSSKIIKLPNFQFRLDSNSPPDKDCVSKLIHKAGFDFLTMSLEMLKKENVLISCAKSETFTLSILNNPVHASLTMPVLPTCSHSNKSEMPFTKISRFLSIYRSWCPFIIASFILPPVWKAYSIEKCTNFKGSTAWNYFGLLYGGVQRQRAKFSNQSNSLPFFSLKEFHCSYNNTICKALLKTVLLFG